MKISEITVIIESFANLIRPLKKITSQHKFYILLRKHLIKHCNILFLFHIKCKWVCSTCQYWFFLTASYHCPCTTYMTLFSLLVKREPMPTISPTLLDVWFFLKKTIIIQFTASRFVSVFSCYINLWRHSVSCLITLFIV